MKTNEERFNYDLGPINPNFDAELIVELVGIYTRYASSQEYRLMADRFVELLRLIRAGPVQLFDNPAEYAAFARNLEDRMPIPSDRPTSDRWLPNLHRGMILILSTRHPLVRMLVTHCPPEHRVWRYVRPYKA